MKLTHKYDLYDPTNSTIHSFHSVAVNGRRTSGSSRSLNLFQPQILTGQVRLQRKSTLYVHWRTDFDGGRFNHLRQTHPRSSIAVNPSLTPFLRLRVVVVAAAGRHNLCWGETPMPVPLPCIKKIKIKNTQNLAGRLWCGRRKTTGRDWEECWWGTNQSTLLLIQAIVSRPLCYGVEAARCCVVANTFPQLTATSRTEDRAAELVRIFCS